MSSCDRQWKRVWARPAPSAFVAAPSFEAGLVHEIGVRLPERSFRCFARPNVTGAWRRLAPIVRTANVEADRSPNGTFRPELPNG